MPTANIDGILTRYELVGSGPPVLMFSPGGFDATLDQWTDLGVYARTRMLQHLSESYTCIIFDRRECGESGGRLEHLTWLHFAAQGKGLLNHLKIGRAHLLGGCMGCGPVLAFAVAYPNATLSMILYWPVGGAKYRINVHQRFAEHLAYVQQHGLEQVVRLVTEEGKPFNKDSVAGRGRRSFGATALSPMSLSGKASTTTNLLWLAWPVLFLTAIPPPGPNRKTCSGSTFAP